MHDRTGPSGYAVQRGFRRSGLAKSSIRREPLDRNQQRPRDI